MTQTTFKRVPFNLELAKKIASKETKGRIVTRDGRQVRIICFDKIEVHGACQIVALFEFTQMRKQFLLFPTKVFIVLAIRLVTTYSLKSPPTTATTQTLCRASGSHVL